MDRRSGIRDYAVLAMVGRRRGLSMQQQLQLAQAEHRECLARQAEHAAALQASMLSCDEYARKVQARTAAGSGVRLVDLQGAREHGKTLKTACDEARGLLSEAGRRVDLASDACAEWRRKLAANEARVESLDDQAKAWTRALAMEREDQEEDERGDSYQPRLA